MRHALLQFAQVLVIVYALCDKERFFGRGVMSKSNLVNDLRSLCSKPFILESGFLLQAICATLLTVTTVNGLAGDAQADRPGTAQQIKTASAGESTSHVEELRKFSIEDLVHLPIQTSGTLVPTTQFKAPSAITVITAEDIRLTPHRNLLDLIEIYVPGAIVMTHSDGMKLGMRGITSDRNLKFLLLVNGRNVNQTAHSGAAAELTNWDLNDIKRVEIIRGPGSVTYGPGAIAGVVNIITRSAADATRPEVTVKYTGEYDSKMASASYGLKNKQYELFAHLSIAATDGLDDTRAYSLQGPLADGTGFVGSRDFRSGSRNARPPHSYFEDFEGEPQYKAYIDLKFLDEWRLWTRFSSSGGSGDYRDSITAFQTGLTASGDPLFGRLTRYKQIQVRDAVAQLENSHEVNSALTLDSTLSLSSQDFERRNFAPLTYAASNAPPPAIQQQLGDPRSVRNLVQNFAEDQLYASLLARLQLSEKTKAVLGGEYVVSHFGPGWGDSSKDFRMGETGMAGVPNIISGPDSNAINPQGVTGFRGLTPAQALFVGNNGWTTQMYSLLGELSFEQLSWFNVIISGRMDKHRDTDYLWSPRLAIISELNRRNYLKLNLQESVRMGTGEQLLLSHLRDEQAKPEKLRAIELAYALLVTDDLQLTATTFYNELDAVGWESTLQRTVPLGTQKYCGLELDANYSVERFRIGLNHSYVKLLDWELAEGITGSGISFSDYSVNVRDRAGVSHILTDSGNELNNWANNITKLYLNYRLTRNFTLHADAQLYWGFEGARDQFRMVQQAAAGTADATSVNAAISQAERQHAFEWDLRNNVSLTWDVRDDFSIQFFVLNLFNINGNRRYDYDTGTRVLSPRVFFVEEPLTVGVMAKVTL